MVLEQEKLAQLLIQNKILDEKKVNTLIANAKDTQTSFETLLIEKGVLTDENLGLLVANYLKLPFVVLSKTSIPEEIFRVVPERLARKYKIVAFGQDPKGIKVALADPVAAKPILEMIQQKTGSALIPHYATEEDIKSTFHLYQRMLQEVFNDLIKSATSSRTPSNYENVSASKIVDLLVKYAYQDEASDVHIEPQEEESIVRFRIDGVLHDVLTLPKVLHDQIATRIKVLSRLRTDEHLSPQDGKMRATLEEENIDIRVSIVPVVDGEKTVMRLLSSKSREFSLSGIGMNDSDLEKVTKGFHKSYGMVLSTGPTGSGKTTSIYSILKILNTRDQNITTTEDPVEYKIKGVNQIQINPKANMTFASSLRSILRQDPNIVFVGEIRDSETANIAVNAALTGHLVLSTLHTNDAATALPRLLDMNIEPFLVASTVNTIVAQRLVRKICEMCRTSYSISQQDASKNLPPDVAKRHFTKKDITLYQGKGCKVCHNSGYSGRVGVFEILEVTKEIRKLIVSKQDSDVIAQQAARDGMASMLDDGLQKALQGVTTIEEVLRVTKVGE